MNIYLKDSRWDELRDQIALRGLTPEDAADEITFEMARGEVSELLAEAHVMPESCRSDFPEQAHVAISFNGLTTNTPIALGGDQPRDMIDFAIRTAARDATESFLHSYRSA